MDQKVSELFELEALGITEIDSVHENFVKDIRFENGHYVVKLPWRQHDILPDNFELCSGRLISTLKRLKKEYDRIINEQLQNGIIEQVYPSLTLLSRKGGGGAKSTQAMLFPLLC